MENITNVPEGINSEQNKIYDSSYSWCFVLLLCYLDKYSSYSPIHDMIIQADLHSIGLNLNKYEQGLLYHSSMPKSK